LLFFSTPVHGFLCFGLPISMVNSRQAALIKTENYFPTSTSSVSLLVKECLLVGGASSTIPRIGKSPASTDLLIEWSPHRDLPSSSCSPSHRVLLLRCDTHA
jgi:hypothetical protein